MNNSVAACGVTSNGYSDYFSTNTINLVAGQSYNFNIENQGQPGLMYCSIYIDLNQNGTFDSGETAFEHNGGTEVSSGSITIPNNAINGETRLRVRGYFNAISNACDQTSYGETEDYKVVISSGKESMVIGAQISAVTESSIDIVWQAAGNSNPTGFTLLQSTDGSTFTPLVTVANSIFAYQHTGLNSGSTYYYQIIANGTVDSDPRTIWGTTTTSTTASLNENEAQLIIHAYPNPFDNEIVIDLEGEVGQVEIINPLGQVVLIEDVYGIEKIHTENWSPGLYYLKVILDNEVREIKMMKK